jgi:branched-subunit amino acid aminotransferase/4-amino-4-deoxychorismate lyase
VFELVVISDGSIYQLEQHLSRLIESAGRAAIFTPMSLPQMMRTVLETAGAACIPNGELAGYAFIDI